MQVEPELNSACLPPALTPRGHLASGSPTPESEAASEAAPYGQRAPLFLLATLRLLSSPGPSPR